MLTLHHSTARGYTAEGEHYVCVICGSGHKRNGWGVAYCLNHTGAMFATNLHSKFIAPGWCCKDEYNDIQKFYNNSAETNTIKSLNVFKFVDVSPAVTFQSEIKIDGPDYIILNLKNLIQFVKSNSVCNNCKCIGTLECISYQQRGFDSFVTFQCFNCKKNLYLNSSSPIENSTQRVLSKKLICATQFSGIGFSQLSNAFDLVGLPVYNDETSMYKTTNTVWSKISDITDAALLESLRYVSIMRLMADGLSFFGMDAVIAKNHNKRRKKLIMVYRGHVHALVNAKEVVLVNPVAICVVMIVIKGKRQTNAVIKLVLVQTCDLYFFEKLQKFRELGTIVPP